MKENKKKKNNNNIHLQAKMQVIWWVLWQKHIKKKCAQNKIMTAGEFSVAIFSWVLQSENSCPAQSQAKCLFYRIFSEWYYIIIIIFFF